MDKTRVNKDRELSPSEYETERQARQAEYKALVEQVPNRLRTLLQLPPELKK